MFYSVLFPMQIPNFDFFTEIPVNRAEKRFYPVHARTEFGETYGILCDIAVKDCSKLLTIRGIVQVAFNLLSFNLCCYHILKRFSVGYSSSMNFPLQ